MLEGSFVRKQVGPLPMWAWMGLTLGAALAYVSYRNGKTPTTKATDSTLPADNLGPLYVIQNYDQDQTYVTVPTAPPAGGRPPGPPPGPPVGGRPISIPRIPPPVFRIPPAPPAGGGPISIPQLPTTPPFRTPTVPAPTPPAAPAGQWADVVKWMAGQPAGTPSTLWGMAEKFYGNGASWRQIWDAPQNAAIRSKRGTPEKIQQGDRFWVPTK